MIDFLLTIVLMTMGVALAAYFGIRARNRLWKADALRNNPKSDSIPDHW